MAGVETELIKPDGMIVNAKSNKDGYTNFKCLWVATTIGT